MGIITYRLSEDDVRRVGGDHRLHAGSRSAKTLTSAMTTQPSATSAALVARTVASAFTLVWSRGVRTNRLTSASEIMIATMTSFATRSARYGVVGGSGG